MHHDRGRGRSRAVAGVLAAVIAGLVALAAGAPTAAVAQDSSERLDPDAIGLSATAGFGGQAVRGRTTPVEVRIAPDRLVAGELRVRTEVSGRGQTEVRQVEVSAGSAKVFRFVTPPSAAMTVELETDEGTATARVEADRSARYLIGMLVEELPRDVPPITAPGYDASAVVVPVPPAWLSLGTAALDSIASLVVDQATLAGLDDATIASIDTWVAAGADLVVVAAPGTVDLPVRWNPAREAAEATVELGDGARSPAREIVAADAWTLTVADITGGDDATPIAATTNAGRGRVTVVGVGIGEGSLGSDGALWGRVAPPRGVHAQFDDNGSVTRLLDVAPQTLQTGAIDLPGLGGLALFLIAYVLVVGPINGVVLTRLRRPELAWGTIPAITLVFAAAAWVGAGSTNPGVGLSGSAAWWIDGSGAETTVAGVRSPRADDVELELAGDDWHPMYASWGRSATIDRDGGSTRIGMQLESLELGTVVATRTLASAPPLQVSISERGPDATLTIVVENTTTVAIEDVEVRAGTLFQELGDLAPGERAEGTIDDAATLRSRNAWEDDVQRDRNGIPESPGSLESVLRWQVLDLAPGVVWAVGSAPDGVPGITTPVADGSPTAGIGSFVAVGVTPQASGAVLPTDVQRDLVVPGFGQLWRSTPWAVEGQLEAVLRYRLPHVDGIETLVSTLDRGELFNEMRGEMCFGVELRGPDGELLSAHDTCGDPAFPEPPPCPPDAQFCEFDGETFTMCDDEGACIEGDLVVVDVPEEIPGGGGIEVWDVTDGEWVGLRQAFADDRAPADRYLSPLGEVLVRARGEMHPFEFSGRGLAAETTREASR